MADSNAALGSAAFNLASWPGMSNAAALKMAKNYTGIFDEDKDPLKRSGEALGEKIEATFGPEVTKDFTKANATLNALGTFVTAGKADDQYFIDDLNSRLAKYNIKFEGMLYFAFFYLLLRRKTRLFPFSRKCFFNSRPRFFFADLFLSSFSPLLFSHYSGRQGHQPPQEVQ
jgi:hypothetical protein